MSTKGKIALFGGLGLFLVVVLAIAAVIVVVDHKHDNAVADARVAAEAFEADLADFRRSVEDEVGDGANDVHTSLAAAQELTDALPELGDAPDYGKEHSTAYSAAEATREQLQEDMAALIAAIEAGVEADEFLKETEAALDGSFPPSLLGEGAFADGQPIRDSAIPAMRAHRDEFAAVSVPNGFEEAADLTVGALDYVITELGAMADSLDQGQSYSFSFTEAYAAARTGVDEALAEVVGAFNDALELVVDGVPAGQES